MLRRFKSLTPRDVLIFCFLAAAGIVGNYASVPLFIGASFVFGSIAVWIVLDLYGLRLAVIASALASSYTIFLFGHPYATAIFMLETLLVGLAMRRGHNNLLVLDGLFWLLVGPVLSWGLYGIRADLTIAETAVLFLKQAINGTFNALIASLILTHSPIRRIAGRGRQADSVSLRTTAFTFFLAMVFIPAMLILVESGRTERFRLEKVIMGETETASSTVAAGLREWHSRHLNGLVLLARTAAENGIAVSDRLQEKTELTNSILPEFNSLAVADADGKTVAFSPRLDQKGQSNIGVSCLGPYFEQLCATRRPVLSEVFTASAGAFVPVSIMAVPIIEQDKFVGFARGSLNLGAVCKLLDAHGKGNYLRITLLDKEGRVIACTENEQDSPPPSSRLSRGRIVPLRDGGVHWFPTDENLPTIARWKKSVVFHETAVSDEIPWTLHIEIPVGPHISQMVNDILLRLSIMAGIAILAFPLAHVFSRSLARPIGRLADITMDPERLLDGRNVEYSKGAAKEIQLLELNFITMAEALKRNFRELRERGNELRRATMTLSAIVEASPLPIISLDPDRRLVVWNKAAEKTFGWEAREVLGGPVPFLPENEGQESFVLQDEEFDDRMGADLCLRCCRKDGRRIDVALWSAPIRDPSDGKSTSILGLMADITDRKQNERALRESEEKFRKLFEEGPLGMAILFEDHRFSQVNNKLCRMLGYSADELNRFTFDDITHPEDLDRELALAKKLFSGELQVYELEKRYINKSGGIMWSHLTATAIRDGSGTPVYLIAMIEDITNRKEAEEELRRSEEWFKILFECAPDPYYLMDQDGAFIDGNRAAVRMTGYKRAELVGKNFVELDILVPADTPRAYELLDNSLRGRSTGPDEFTLKARNGQQVVLEIRTYPAVIRGQTFILGIARDITERKRMEKERQVIEARLSQAQKMEAIGTLAGGIAHDFNNILAAIIGYSDLALSEIPRDDRMYFFLEQILKSGFRARDLVKQILEFSRQGKHEKKPLKLCAIIKETVNMLKATIPSSIEINTAFSCEYDWVWADATQLHQVLMNLCTNASHAMRGGVGVLGISVESVAFDAAHGGDCPGLKDGTYLKIEVSDTGHGMPAEVLERIFEPYFTTKGVGEGTGLGLAVVQGLVKEHGGAITVQSEPGKGSVFRIYLPPMEEIEEEERQYSTLCQTGTEHILFVDDEPALMELGKMVLEHLGYKVTSRTSSIDALEVFRMRPGKFDLVVTDLAMPRMRGTELALEIRKIQPEIPVILCTGFSQQMDADKAKEAGIEEIVLKPLVMNEIAGAIRRALEKRNPGSEVA